MENNQPIQEQQEAFEPNMFWEGFFYLSFFIFTNIVLIPYTPKSWSFGRYYPIALITYGAVGVVAGLITFRIVKNAPNWVKFGIMAILYIIMLAYLLTNVHRFTTPA